MMNAEFLLKREVVVFSEDRCLAKGSLGMIADGVRRACDEGRTVLALDALTSEVVDFDWRHSPGEVMQSIQAGEVPPEQRKPGRPKLGVIAREVTLLPRHWDWLNAQPGGASVALRKLVEEARRKNQDVDQLRQIQESVCRFMTTLAGDRAGFEEGLRAFYAKDAARFREETKDWPDDIRQHLHGLADMAFKLAAEIAKRPPQA